MIQELINIKKIALYLITLIIPFLLWCSMGPVAEGGSEVVGKLASADLKGISGATVTLYNFRTDNEIIRLDSGSAESTITDMNGDFSIKPKNHGTYYLYGSYKNDSLIVIKSNVAIDSGVKKDLGTLEMSAPGTVSGIILGTDSIHEGFDVYIPGTSNMAKTGDNGEFFLSNIPQGSYSVFISKSGYLTERLREIVIYPALDTNIDIIRMKIDPKELPPEPQSFATAYDTLSGKFFFKWNKVPVEDLKEYRILRDGFDVVASVTDTFLEIDFSHELESVASEMMITFQVQAIDLKNNEGYKSDVDSFVAIPPSFVHTSFDFEIPQINPSDEDSVNVIVTFLNNYRSIQSLTWALGSKENTIRINKNINQYSGQDTLRLKASPDHEYHIFVTTISGEKIVDTKDLKVNGSEFYTPGTWAFADSLNTRRSGTSLCAVGNDFIVAGGYQLSGSFLPGTFRPDPKGTCEIFKSEKGTWESLPSLISPRFDAAMTSIDSCVYIIGGTTSPSYGILSPSNIVEKFNYNSNTWSVFDTLDFDLTGSAAASYNECIYLCGGSLGDGTSATPTDKIWRYNVKEKLLVEIGKMSSSRTLHRAVIQAGVLYIAGGMNSDDEPVSTFETFDLNSLHFSFLPDLSQPRAGFGMEIINDDIYFIGGRNNVYSNDSNSFVNDIEIFDINGGYFESSQPAPIKRYKVSTFIDKKRIFVVGGFGTDGKATSFVQMYYP